MFNNLSCEIRKNMDLFCETMDSCHFVVTNPGSKKDRFVPYDTNLDLVCILDFKIMYYNVKIK